MGPFPFSLIIFPNLRGNLLGRFYCPKFKIYTCGDINCMTRLYYFLANGQIAMSRRIVVIVTSKADIPILVIEK
jgi:hypothetical protein